MASALDAARTATAHPILMERIVDVSGDAEVDERRFQELLARENLIRRARRCR